MAEKKILVVDDEAHIRQAVMAALEGGGYQVDSAENGRQAVDKCRSFRPDLAILDVRMPVMDGHMASIEIHYDPALKDVKFMFLSANTDDDSRNFAFGHGAEAYLTKPFRVEELLEKVRKLLEPGQEKAEKPEGAPRREPSPAPQAAVDEKAKAQYLEGLKNKFKK